MACLEVDSNFSVSFIRLLSSLCWKTFHIRQTQSVSVIIEAHGIKFTLSFNYGKLQNYRTRIDTSKSFNHSCQTAIIIINKITHNRSDNSKQIGNADSQVLGKQMDSYMLQCYMEDSVHMYLTLPLKSLLCLSNSRVSRSSPKRLSTLCTY